MGVIGPNNLILSTLNILFNVVLNQCDMLIKVVFVICHVTSSMYHPMVCASTVKWTTPYPCLVFSESDLKLYTNFEFYGKKIISIFKTY